MRAALIVNPQAGALSALGEPRAALTSALRAAGFLLGDDVAEGAPIEEQWRAVDVCDPEVVFVAGGDGTLRSAAARLLDRRRALAPLPGGTMNRVCARLGLPNDPLAAAAVYRPDFFTNLDVATANGEVFLYQSIVGQPSRLMRFREMQRGEGWRGWWPVLRAAGREMLRPPGQGLALRTGPRGRAQGHAAVVTLPAPGNPGLLVLDLARPVGPTAQLRQAIRWLRGGLSQDAQVRTFLGNRLVIHGPTPWLRLSLDGEMHLVPGPLRFRLHPGALRLLQAPRPG
jgi:diacylglycerol kinase family enzyme